MTEVRRVAILGGGMASLATALELTAAADWRSRLDITVYQTGWRLGGKGASSRNREVGDRVEEHGLHVWFGCYNEAFRLLRGCYEELQRPPGSPFATLDDAFTPQNETPYFEQVDGRWTVWPMWFPPNPSPVGTGGPKPSVWDYLVMAIEGLAHAGGELLHLAGPDAGRPHHTGAIPEWLAAHLPHPLRHTSDAALGHAAHLARSMPPDPAAHRDDHHSGLVWLLERGKTWALNHLSAATADTQAVRRAVIELDLGLTLALGCLRDGVHRSGFGVIDDEDARAWFRRHGAAPASVDSTPMRALYDLYFAYAGGDTARPSFSAGVAINAVLRLALDYKGAVVNEMRAGMGEVVIAPVYEVLAQRGVKFAFFHRVERLELNPGRSTVARIHIARQVELADGSDTGYEPLTKPIQGVRCWPGGPLVEQIKDGERLAGIDLESRWSGWTDVGHRTLEAGRDFDVAVLGISLAGLLDVAADFRADDRWRDLFDQVGTTQTQAFQLWMDVSLTDLGWTDGPVPADAAPEPLDVWADRTEVLAFEAWPDPAPLSLQYLCGPMTGDAYLRPPDDLDVPRQALDDATATLAGWLDDRGVALWPGARAPEGGFDWSQLHAPGSVTGQDRLAAQFRRANIDPSERYVLSLPGTAKYRLPADGSGYDNLVLAGDWTQTDWNVGCIEAAVISGINAARAIDDAPPA
jgi:uncharacterized protein with NAD-binding domain and iron-sulfur cluster